MSRAEFLPFYAPDIGEDEIREVTAALRSGWLTTGHRVDMDAIGQIAAEHGLAVVQDAAHALASAWRGQPVGGPMQGLPPESLTCFSFYATKNVTTGEGGMLTGDPALVDEARTWIL